jgi:hypothetical protein
MLNTLVLDTSMFDGTGRLDWGWIWCPACNAKALRIKEIEPQEGWACYARVCTHCGHREGQ